MYQNISRCIKMYQNVSKCIKIYQNISKCIKMYHISSYTIMHPPAFSFHPTLHHLTCLLLDLGQNIRIPEKQVFLLLDVDWTSSMRRNKHLITWCNLWLNFNTSLGSVTRTNSDHIGNIWLGKVLFWNVNT